MDVINNSTIDTVIDFANVKFGMELTKDQVSEQLRNLSFSETLKLINSMKSDDNDAFSSIIDLSAVSEGWSELPSMNREKYIARDGLEGPIMTKSGKVVYYDPKEGSYYDPDTDMYIDYETWKMLDSENMHKIDMEEAVSRLKKLSGLEESPADIYTTDTDDGELADSTMHGLLDKIEDYYHEKNGSDELDVQIGDDDVFIGNDHFSIYKNNEDLGDDLYNELEQEDIAAGRGPIDTELNEYGTINTARPSRATIRAGTEKVDVANRRANNINQDMNRDSNVPNRTVAGGNKQPTGQGAVRAGSADPDDIERANNANVSAQNQQQTNINAQEIERLKQLALGG